MDEAFLRRALQAMGEENIVSIKVMKNKMTGENANYGFINFENDYSALLAMHKLNSKVIPETNPVRAFKFFGCFKFNFLRILKSYLKRIYFLWLLG
jgi:hypothetical protein